MTRPLSNLDKRPASAAGQPTADWVIIPDVRRVHLLFPLRSGVYVEKFSHELSAFIEHLQFLIEEQKPRSLLVYVAPSAKQQIVNDLLAELKALASNYDVSLASLVLPRGNAAEYVHLLCRDAGESQ